jgi:hypothetical protein
MNLAAIAGPPHSGARFSRCGKYRPILWRIWSDGPLFGACYLNPSKAGATFEESDPTVSRTIARARAAGYAGLLLANACDLISTDPAGLYAARRKHSAECDQAILEVATRSAVFVCGWGQHLEKAIPGRGARILAMIRRAGVVPHAFKLNSDGSPCHPLYLPYALRPVPMP